jgi:Ca2+-binding EF-hand superfamily protein
VWQTAVELAATRGKLRALFVLLDEDGSGELTAEELQALGRAIGAWLLID